MEHSRCYHTWLSVCITRANITRKNVRLCSIFDRRENGKTVSPLICLEINCFVFFYGTFLFSLSLSLNYYATFRMTCEFDKC